MIVSLFHVPPHPPRGRADPRGARDGAEPAWAARPRAHLPAAGRGAPRGAPNEDETNLIWV